MLRKLFNAVFKILLIINFCRGFEILDDGDQKFKKYLIETMTNYSSWLKSNQFDPSPPITDGFHLDAGCCREIYLECDLSRLYLSGHSDTLADTVTAEASFLFRFFGIDRTVLQPYAYHGDFNCTGAIKKEYAEELENDLSFSGQGTFRMTIRNSFEYQYFEKFRITEDFKFDMSHCSMLYALNADAINTQLEANWDDVFGNSKYVEIVKKVFGDVCDFEFRLSNRNSGLTQPQCSLLETYLRESVDGLELISIGIPPETVPPPYTETLPRTTTFAAIISSTSEKMTSSNTLTTAKLTTSSNNPTTIELTPSTTTPTTVKLTPSSNTMTTVDSTPSSNTPTTAKLTTSSTIIPTASETTSRFTFSTSDSPESSSSTGLDNLIPNAGVKFCGTTMALSQSILMIYLLF